MKPRGLWHVAFLVLLLTATSCEKPKPKPPVVHAPPVYTRPFEEGYEAGFAAGKEAGKPRATVPAPADAEAIARARATDDYERSDKWQRGYVAGYVDGFRQKATGAK